MVSDIVAHFIPIEGFGKNSQTNNISALIQIYFNLIAKLIPYEISTFNTDVLVPMVLN